MLNKLEGVSFPISFFSFKTFSKGRGMLLNTKRELLSRVLILCLNIILIPDTKMKTMFKSKHLYYFVKSANLNFFSIVIMPSIVYIRSNNKTQYLIWLTNQFIRLYCFRKLYCSPPTSVLFCTLWVHTPVQSTCFDGTEILANFVMVQDPQNDCQARFGVLF